MLDPIEIGQKYETVDGEIVTILSTNTWNSVASGSSGSATYKYKNETVLVYKDGPFAGQNRSDIKTPRSLLRLIPTAFQPQQLTLF